MELFGALRRYKRRLEKKFTKQIRRGQFNFACDERIILGLKMMAQCLEAPVYVVAEHTLQLGASELMVIVEDEALRERLCRHLVEDHLLTPVTKPESEPTSQRALKLENAMGLLELLETRSSLEEQKKIILRLMEKAKKE